MTAVPVNCFQDGVQGATLAAGGSGQAGLGTAAGVIFDTVVLNSGSLTYDSTHSYSGTQSCLVSTSSTAGAPYGLWASSGSLTPATQVWFRLYVYQPANPGTSHTLFWAGINGTRSADLIVTLSGNLSMRNAAGTVVFTTTSTVPLNQWFRVEGYVLSDAAAGQVELKLFTSPASVTATETQTSGANLNTAGGQITQARFGITVSTVSNISYWMDNPACSATGYIGPGPVLQSMIAGAPWQNGFTVASKAPGATSLRLKVATNSGLTQNVAWVSAQTPDSYGYVQHQVTGLSAQARYYFGLYDTPPGGTEAAVAVSSAPPLTGSCKTLPPAGSPQSFKMAVASCINTALNLANEDTAITDWVNWQPDLAVFTGDFDYINPTSTSVTAQIAAYESQILDYGGQLATLIAQTWGFYNRSNHDAYETEPAENTDSDNAATTANIQAAQEVFPWGTPGDSRSPTAGLYQSWVCGRVRFIQVDIRNTDRSPNANTDNSSKTMLGAIQLTWFYSQLLMPEPLKIVVGDTAWMGNISGASGDLEAAKWWSYSTERSAILSFIAANQPRVQNMIWIHGDTHGVGCATAAQNSSYGGFPVYCAAPMRQTGGGYNTNLFGQFYDNAGGDCRFYGRVIIADDGHTITVNFQGWDAVNQVAQVAQTDTFTCPSQAPAKGGLLAGLPI